MSLEESLIDMFQVRGILSGDELYLNIQDSFDFIKACTDLKLAISGVDFFPIKAEGTYPIYPIKDLDCSSFLRKHEQWVYILRKFFGSTYKKVSSIDNGGYFFVSQVFLR